MPAETHFQIRDQRGSNRFFIDNAFFRGGYAARVGPYGIAIYNALVFHAHYQSQDCYPSYRSLAQETGMSKRQAQRKIAELIELRVILSSPRSRQDGSQTSNIYTLTAKEAWLPIDAHQTLPDDSQSPPISDASQSPGDSGAPLEQDPSTSLDRTQEDPPLSPPTAGGNVDQLPDSDTPAESEDDMFTDMFGEDKLQTESFKVPEGMSADEAVRERVGRIVDRRAETAKHGVTAKNWGKESPDAERILKRSGEICDVAREMGYRLEYEAGFGPVWGNREVVKQWTHGLVKIAKLLQDTYIPVEAYRILTRDPENELTLRGPHSLYNTCVMALTNPKQFNKLKPATRKRGGGIQVHVGEYLDR